LARTEADSQRRIEIGKERRARTRAKIVAAAFELFGEENGLYVRIEDIAARAGITRPTFYDHFSGMAELRDAVTYEMTHDFLLAVSHTVSLLDDPRERASAAIRFYLGRVREDARWGWSMINLSANGVIFGAETCRQAEQTVREGIAMGKLGIGNSAIGRDIVMGASLAAMATMLRDDPGEDYPRQMAESILMGMGVPAADASEISRRPAPRLVTPE
jgi:AcrR family transcriptional regulator